MLPCRSAFKAAPSICRRRGDRLALRVAIAGIRVSVLLALTTVPDPEAAERIARVLVEERLAGYVSRMPDVHSTYRWQGTLHDEPEVLLLIKTTAARFDELKARLSSLHPHDVPELLAVPVCGGLDRYLGWIEAETARQ